MELLLIHSLPHDVPNSIARATGGRYGYLETPFSKLHEATTAICHIWGLDRHNWRCSMSRHGERKSDFLVNVDEGSNPEVLFAMSFHSMLGLYKIRPALGLLMADHRTYVTLP